MSFVSKLQLTLGKNSWLIQKAPRSWMILKQLRRKRIRLTGLTAGTSSQMGCYISTSQTVDHDLMPQLAILVVLHHLRSAVCHEQDDNYVMTLLLTWPSVLFGSLLAWDTRRYRSGTRPPEKVRRPEPQVSLAVWTWRSCANSPEPLSEQCWWFFLRN